MAHLRPLPSCVHAGCRRPATDELYSTYNAPMGTYCKIHGRIALTLLQDREARDHRPRDARAEHT